MLCDLNNNVSKKIWALVDCDSFFVWCEILRNPKLENKFVCVGRENDIILASSKNAKLQWVKTGTPSWEAKKIIKDLIIIKPDFDFYKFISNKLFQYLKTFVNDIEIFSIDECFIDITWFDKRFWIDYKILLNKLKLSIKKKVWIKTSIWASKTKLLSKMFVDLAKPFWSFFEDNKTNIDNILKKMNLTDITFIAKWWENKLKYLCKSAYDFKNLDYWIVKKIMWKHWTKLRMELNWINCMSFENPIVPKSISRTHSFHPYFSDNFEKIREYIVENFEKWYQEMINKNLATKWFILFLKTKDFKYQKIEFKFHQLTTDKNLLFDSLKNQFKKIFQNTFYRQTWIIFLWLESAKYINSNIFYWNESLKSQKIQQIINKLNLKFWQNMIKILWNKNAEIWNKNLRIFWDIKK